MEQDFAQNYLCELQNGPSAIDWLHKQTTIHLTVVYYRCSVDDCCLVTHEVVHVSNDLKHDAYLVEKFHATTMNVLEQDNLLVHQNIKFGDQTKIRHLLITWPKQNCLLCTASMGWDMEKVHAMHVQAM